MDSIDTSDMNDEDKERKNQIEQIGHLFGTFKAEWLNEKIFEFFTEPEYFPELITTARPCMLVGGRGTGKTTVLRGLSYEGRYILTGRIPDAINGWDYYGLYYRVNTNRVTAFQGNELTEDEWRKRFAHYFNIALCELVINFLLWYKTKCTAPVDIGSLACRRVSRSLQIDTATTIEELAENLDLARIDFESYINNVADAVTPRLSLQGAPIDILVDAVMKLPQFKGKAIFFLIDEFETFSDDQQRVVNTLIKHAGQSYSFKIGVKELGLRCRETLSNEQLTHPADFALISIVEKLNGEVFKSFALRVCSERMSKMESSGSLIRDMKRLLQDMSEDEEAVALGAEDSAAEIKTLLAKTASAEQITALDKLPPLQIYFIKFWADGQNLSLQQALEDYLVNRSQSITRYNNYKHALLYTLNEGKSGIRKYYSGWDTFVQLSGNNIRYLIELVYQSLLLHVQGKVTLAVPVSPATQTYAAQEVGRVNLTELEGLANDGANLKKLLLSLGRVFQIMAAKPLRHSPEVNHFQLSSSNAHTSIVDEVNRLLTSAVMHLAVIRSPGNKLGGETSETKDYDYMLHPIYSPFFVFSYRKKRKMRLSYEHLLSLVKSPRQGITYVLNQSNRLDARVAIGELPDQLLLFENFYNAPE